MQGQVIGMQSVLEPVPHWKLTGPAVPMMKVVESQLQIPVLMEIGTWFLFLVCFHQKFKLGALQSYHRSVFINLQGN